MARYIQILKDDEPQSLNAIDALICEHFKAPVHDVNYYAPPHEFNWYDQLGWSTASNLDEAIAHCAPESGLKAVFEFLKFSGYELTAWYGI